jgi:hypothetical protein
MSDHRQRRRAAERPAKGIRGSALLTDGAELGGAVLEEGAEEGEDVGQVLAERHLLVLAQLSDEVLSELLAQHLLAGLS